MVSTTTRTFEVRRATRTAALRGADGDLLVSGRTGEVVETRSGTKAFAGLAPDLFAGDAAALGLVRAAGGVAELLQTDVTDEASVDAMVGNVVARFGKLDILYTNAGGPRGHDGPVTRTPAGGHRGGRHHSRAARPQAVP